MGQQTTVRYRCSHKHTRCTVQSSGLERVLHGRALVRFAECRCIDNVPLWFVMDCAGDYQRVCPFHRMDDHSGGENMMHGIRMRNI